MTEYKIIKVGDDFYVAHEDFKRDAWRTDVKLGSATLGGNKSVVERAGEYIEPYAEVDNVKFRFGPTEEDNYVSINDATEVKLNWAQASHLLYSLREKSDFDDRVKYHNEREERLAKAAQGTPNPATSITVNVDGVATMGKAVEDALEKVQKKR